MKYIRTKDGIYKQTDIVRLARSIAENCYPENYDYDNIKQADTIEELCDEFVFDGIVWDKLEDVMFCLDKKDYTKIYGAIWTNKGLIYVAKMNKEGKLCLI